MVSRKKISVRFAETDQTGRVHYSIYPIWYEAARMELVKKAGVLFSKLTENGIRFPLFEMNCKYFISAEYGDVLTVKVNIDKVTSAKIVFHYEIYKAGIENPIHIGSTAHNWVGVGSKPVNLKKEYPDLFEKISGLAEI